MDQDNALIFAQGEPDGREDRWFAALGAQINDILHEAGVPCSISLICCARIKSRKTLCASNTVAIKNLSQRDQIRLRTSLRAVEQIDELTRDLLFKD
jgi:hypothetical protein